MAFKTERFSLEIQPTLEDFTTSGWKEAFTGPSSQCLASAADTLAKKGQKALEEDDAIHRYVPQLKPALQGQ